MRFSKDSTSAAVPAAAIHTRGLTVAPPPARRRWPLWTGAIMAVAMAASIVGLGQAIGSLKPTPSIAAISASHYGDALKKLDAAIIKLENDQVKYELSVVSDVVLRGRLSAVRIDASLHSPTAGAEIAQLQQDLAGWQKSLNAKVAAQAAAASPVTSNGLNVPIVMFHATPGDFDRQLSNLSAKGYTTITMHQLADALLNHTALPAKPVVITFDDGLANQITAFNLLVAHHMKATYYIIDGGPGSSYHIGANRHTPDPLGGWDYLTWDQIRQLDQSGTIEIGSHTVDHMDLPRQTPAVLQFEVADGKAQLEAQIGHAVETFAYPYGNFNGAVIDAIRRAGFTSAVTTVPGTFHSAGDIYTLTRVRDIYALP